MKFSYNWQKITMMVILLGLCSSIMLYGNEIHAASSRQSHILQSLNKNNSEQKDNRQDSADTLSSNESEAETAHNQNSEESVEHTAPDVAEGNNLFTTVKQGGPLMIVLILMGLLALTIIIERLLYYTLHQAWKKDTIEKMIQQRLERSNASYREDITEELAESVHLYFKKLERGLALLSGLGNLAPLTGFLGTVTGMISAFAAIAAATTVNAKVVAVGIQVALVTTAGGLIVAVPALACYYFFLHIIQNRLEYAEEVISDITLSLPRISENVPVNNEQAGIIQ